MDKFDHTIQDAKQTYEPSSNFVEVTMQQIANHGKGTSAASQESCLFQTDQWFARHHAGGQREPPQEHFAISSFISQFGD